MELNRECSREEKKKKRERNVFLLCIVQQRQSLCTQQFITFNITHLAASYTLVLFERNLVIESSYLYYSATKWKYVLLTFIAYMKIILWSEVKKIKQNFMHLPLCCFMNKNRPHWTCEWIKEKEWSFFFIFISCISSIHYPAIGIGRGHTHKILIILSFC